MKTVLSADLALDSVEVEQSLCRMLAHVAVTGVDDGHCRDCRRTICGTRLVVPHRDEFTDTVGFVIEGPKAKALYIPDIDRWERWTRSIRDLANRVDLAFVDGTFSSPAEVKGRSITEIPHPMIPATRELLQGVRAQVWFIHLNHTNPALSGASDVAREGMEFGL